MMSHLTNFSLNKKSDKFTVDDSDAEGGHKRLASSVFAELGKRGIDPKKLKAYIKDMCVKTVISI
jgi:hypothetical protein